MQFRCCGVTNHTDWFEVYNASRVPDSCCLEYSDNCGLDNPGTWWTAVSSGKENQSIPSKCFIVLYLHRAINCPFTNALYKIVIVEAAAVVRAIFEFISRQYITMTQWATGNKTDWTKTHSFIIYNAYPLKVTGDWSRIGWIHPGQITYLSQTNNRSHYTKFSHQLT